LGSHVPAVLALLHQGIRPITISELRKKTHALKFAMTAMTTSHMHATKATPSMETDAQLRVQLKLVGTVAMEATDSQISAGLSDDL
jgi:hypothetical protein